MFQVFKVSISATYANAMRLKLGLKIALAATFFLQCFMGDFDATAQINMASLEEFFVNLYIFELEYSSDAASSTSSYEDDAQDDRTEELIGRLVSLDWCICQNCEL